MPVYKYVAVNSQKQQVKGKFIAASQKELNAELAKRNLYVVSASVCKEGSSLGVGAGKVPLKELTMFCRQFAIMLTSGIPVLLTLGNLKKQKYSYQFKSVLQSIYDDVKGGDMLSAAIEKHRKAFPNFFRSMVHIGEASGKLSEVFVSLADYYEADAAVKRKVKAAMAYPLMLLGLAVGIVILMLAFVVPTFQDTMVKMDVEVTGFTKTVYDASEWLTKNWRWALIGTLIGGFLIFLFACSNAGKYTWDVFKIHAPIIKKVQVDLTTARFARAFSLLLSSGMSLTSALDSVGMILGNRHLEKRFKNVAKEVRQGIPLATALEHFRFFPDLLVQMVAVGEKTAAIDEVLIRSCTYFDQCVEASLSGLTAKLQPIMLMVIGGIIGSLFLAVYSPMLSIMNGL
ncbi:MAG: type II secretion system F family protein [Clostridia bacterium]|nr:type II secretion system F family protein [Clostridia bacterium]